MTSFYRRELERIRGRAFGPEPSFHPPAIVPPGPAAKRNTPQYFSNGGHPEYPVDRARPAPRTGEPV